MTKPLVPKIIVGSKLQNVEYEGVGVVCFTCGCIGHQDSSCPRSAPKTPEDVDQVKVSTASTDAEKGPEEKESSGSFGPWMIVQRKASFPKRRQSNGDTQGKYKQDDKKGSMFQVFQGLSEDMVHDILGSNSIPGPHLCPTESGIDNLMKVTKPGSNWKEGKSTLTSGEVLKDISQDAFSGFKFKSGKRCFSPADGKENSALVVELVTSGTSASKQKRDKKLLRIAKEGCNETGPMTSEDVQVLKHQMAGITSQLSMVTKHNVTSNILTSDKVLVEPKPPDTQKVVFGAASSSQGFSPLVDHAFVPGENSNLER